MPGLRDAILIDLSPETGNINELEDISGWLLHRETNLENAEKALLTNSFYVGIAHFDWSDPLLRPQLITFFQQHNQIAWIAIIQPEQLRDIELRRILFENFYDYFSLPLNENISNLATVLGHAYGIFHLQHLESDAAGMDDEFQMVGTSPQMLDIFDQIRKVAKTDAPVLITGESGTGKELIARAIHQRSKRSAYPFVAVNCGALPETLIHSELFGYEKGAFTGAAQRRLGRIEAASLGSLFLDEIGDLDLNLQAHMLRFLQEGTIERLGNNTPMYVDVRVIAATNIDLEKAVEQGRFREDLFYRLSVLNIDLPPLRDRGEDKELLARFFFKKFASDHNGQLRGFADDAIDAINNYAWPGNVRELINRVRRGMIMSDNRLITAQDLKLSEDIVTNEPLRTLNEARAIAEKQAISHTLNRFDNNVSRAAKALGVSRVTLYRMMEKHHMDGRDNFSSYGAH
ncbi:Sigma-54 dependent transcriptional regulator [Marinobacterium lacunae]|uniref:Sigma-54 dependent transcriptional regulator n=1 Tax=Marinobacterium lacunae TaxID=1232683 RepID=A0A081FU93_9GAMM|nr:sigma-54 dependent transcriptional regulator [Marinobacterium lacunae]KEA62098.1 Sigma-54 dependent transcriptional regulator [Marinobacterium lacunae]